MPRALSPERLGALVDAEVERADRLLFTLTPREELDAIGRTQQLADLAYVQQVRAIVAASARLDAAGREFAADELALVLNVGVSTAVRLRHEALGLAALPGVLEAIEAGWFTSRHALAVLRELDEVPALSLEQRIAVATIVLARLAGQTPHELRLLTRKLILLVDLDAAQARQDAAHARRNVRSWARGDGQGVSQATGPLHMIAATEASMRAWLREHPKAPDDPRSEDERMFDLYVSLLTGGTEPGSWQAQIITPFSTAAGGDLELAEIPGYGPILPSTARDLMTDADWSQVAVDENGVVIAAGAPAPASTRPSNPAFFQGPQASKAAPVDWGDERLRLMATAPPEKLRPERLTLQGYVAGDQLKRFLRARDRHCVFPGCHRPVCDVDHRIPWPLGPTSPKNTQLLCRHHHRAKQALFTVELTDDGDYRWTMRGGWQFLRHRQGY